MFDTTAQSIISFLYTNKSPLDRHTKSNVLAVLAAIELSAGQGMHGARYLLMHKNNNILKFIQYLQQTAAKATESVAQYFKIVPHFCQQS